MRAQQRAVLTMVLTVSLTRLTDLGKVPAGQTLVLFVGGSVFEGLGEDGERTVRGRREDGDPCGRAATAQPPTGGTESTAG